MAQGPIPASAEPDAAGPRLGSAAMGAKANTMLVLFNARWDRATTGWPFASRLQTKTIAVHGAAALSRTVMTIDKSGAPLRQGLSFGSTLPLVRFGDRSPRRP